MKTETLVFADIPDYPAVLKDLLTGFWRTVTLLSRHSDQSRHLVSVLEFAAQEFSNFRADCARNVAEHRRLQPVLILHNES